MRKWARRHKRATRTCPHRTPTIKSGPGQRGPVKGGRHGNVTRNKIKLGISNTFKGSVPEVGVVLGIKEKNYTEGSQNLQ